MSSQLPGDRAPQGEEEIEALQKRFYLLLGERKAIFDTSKVTIKQNNETLSQLQKENKELRSQLQALSRQVNATAPKPKQAESQEGVKYRRRLDQLHSQAIGKKRQLQTLKDKLQEMTAEQKGSLTSEDAPLMRQIRVLENRLDKAMIKYNEAQSIRKTYEQIVKRLKEERVGYDNQLAAIERSLKGKEHDFEELSLLSHDARNAKENAEADLRRYEAQITVERMMRDREVHDKKEAVQQRVEMTQKLELEERKKAGNQAIESNIFVSRISANFASEAITQQRLEEEKQKIQDYETAFRRIKEATGVSDVNEVIQKFTTQEDTARNLEELGKEHQSKLEILSNQKVELKKLVDQIKYAAGENMSRKQIDEMDNKVNTSMQRCDKNKQKFERVVQILINVKAGIEHLSERLENIRLEGQGNIPVNDENIIEALDQCSVKLERVYAETKNSDIYQLFEQEQARFNKSGDTASRAATILHAVSSNPQLNSMAGLLDPGSSYNCRVKMNNKDDDEFSEEGLDDELDMDLSERERFRRETQIKSKESKGKSGKRIKSAIGGSRRSRNF